MRRIVSLVLVILLALSVCTTAIYYLAVTVSATENNIDSHVSIADDAEDKLIRVGLMYGSNVTVGFETTTDHGFVFNKINRTGDLSHEPLWTTDVTKVSCIVDANLSKNAMTYSKTSNPANAVIGGYHVELGDGLSKTEAEYLIYSITPVLTSLGIYAIPSYINGGYRVRTGQYTSREDAEEMAKIVATATGMEARVAAPTNTAVAVVDPMTDTLLFEYDDNDVTALGLTAKDSPSGERQYLVTPAKKIYDGVFMFRRYISDSVDGVSLTDIIPLEEYIKGVLPYEISSSWEFEAQKAFAICVRSFIISSSRHERYYQVDVCNTTHCQVYGGRTKITETVEKAVEETRGLIIAYENTIVPAYYSSSVGGVTVAPEDAWGYSPVPGITAVQTPWEQYTKHANGYWTVEVSPNELYKYLRDTKGYTELKGNIASVTIDQLAKNSTYVYQLTFTDIYGNKKTVKATENVRAALSKYVKSANFVVGKGSVEVDEATFITVSTDDLAVQTAKGTYDMGDTEQVFVKTKNGYYTATVKGSTVMTGNGKVTLGDTTSMVERKTVYAEDSNNFIFVGKGWGHGIGISQYGIRDLAKLGYQAADIVKKYFTTSEIRHWQGLK